MPIEKRMDKDVEKVIKELMVSIDYDIEALFESHPSEVEEMVLDAVLLSLDEKEIPEMDWIRFVDEDDLEKNRNEDGDFVNN